MDNSEFNLVTNNLDDIDANDYRISNNIECIGNDIPDPMYSFSSYKWPQKIYTKLKTWNFTSPTPIQAQSLPIILQNRDLIGIARSGSGKTLCYVLPALVYTLSMGLRHWPSCLVITPTRELTHQVERVVKRFKFVRSVCLYGGVSKDVQTMLLKEAHPHIIISTPGRLYDHIERSVTNLENIKYIAIDEADQMLNMRNERAFTNVMQLLPKDRQTLMFSSTWPDKINQIAKQYMRDNYCQVTISGANNLDLTVNRNIEQIIDLCDTNDKSGKLLKFMDKHLPIVSGYNKTIIFVKSAETAEKLKKLLKHNDYFAKTLYSEISQNERNFTIREFKKGVVPILIATDLVARGLDFHNVSVVINYDYPTSINEYIHRIGRTARHDSKGIAYTLFTPKNSHHANDLINLLKETGQEINPDLIKLANEDKTKEKNDRSILVDSSSIV